MLFNTHNLKLIIFIVGYLLLPIRGLNTLKSSEASSLHDEIQETTPKEFTLGSVSVSRNSLNTDKTITLYSPSSSFNTSMPNDDRHLLQTPAVLQKHIADTDVVVLRVDENDKIHNDFHYGINKNNQESNSNNQKATPTLSNIKLVKSSSTASSSSSSSLASETSTTSASSAYFERIELQESLTHVKREKLLLHRNKRYLVFPDGSSFQLVFDLIIPIVDYTNYAIMGITCAVAWELPSKPPSEIIENFRHKLNDGTFGLSRRNDSTQQQLKYINSPQNEMKEGKDGIFTLGGNGEHQTSATVATTSAHKNLITNALKPPTSNSFYLGNNNLQEKNVQISTLADEAPTKFIYSQHYQQHQKMPNSDVEMGDNNQRKTLYGNDNGRPMHRNDFPHHPNNYYKNTANKWNSQNWYHEQQPKHTKPTFNDAGAYWNKDNWWERNKNRIEKQWHEKRQKWSQYPERQSFSTSQQNHYIPPMFSKRTGRNRKILSKPLKHRIYPVFGKRRRRRSSDYPYPHSSVDSDDLAKKLQDIHTREHLRTRQKLYGKIEKLYKTRGHNGTACVLRALCETEKLHLNARNSDTPQSFVMELLRSIFALPKDTLTSSKDSLLHIDAQYSDAVLHAHNSMGQSCSQQYDGCAHGISYDMKF